MFGLNIISGIHFIKSMPACKNNLKSALSLFLYAGIAQLVEQLIRNEQAAGSSPITSSKIKKKYSARSASFLF